VGENATAVRAEVADAASVQAMADAAAKFGCIDILVNNAALYGALCGGRFEAIGEAEWDDAMRANVKGLWQCCKAVVPQMRAGGGSIINMASLATIYGMPFALHYTVSKAAVVGLTRGLARELGRDNIRVNSIAPSAVLTESTREFFGEKHERARGHCWRPGDPAQHHRADHRGRWRDRDACSERSADAGERSATTASACGAGSASHRGMSGAFPPRRGRDRTP